MTLETINKTIRIPIKDIEIKERFREDLGDIEELAENIKNITLLGPVTVTKKDPVTGKHTLVAGYRRLLSGQLLGWTEIDCYIVDLPKEKIVLAEFSENTYRKDWTYSEIYKATKKVLPILKELAKERQRQAGKLYGNGKKNNKDDNNKEEIASGNFPTAISNNSNNDNKGRALDNFSNALGIDRKTLGKIQKIGDAAEENPEKYQPLFKEVDAGKISVNEAAYIIKKDKIREELLNTPSSLSSISLLENKKCDLRCGDFREVLKDIPDNSIDLIFCDPPYKREHLPLYKDLGKLAQRVLKEGGSLVTFVGAYDITAFINKVLEGGRGPNDGLKYWWQICVKHTGKHKHVIQRNVFVYWKPLIWFVKGNDLMQGVESIADYVESTPPSKALHEWEQSTAEAEHVIKKLTIVENQTVLDPCMGSGTTAIAALKLGKQFIGSEIVKERFEIAKKRIEIV